MKRHDMLLVLTVLAAAGFIFLFQFFSDTISNKVTVRINGELYGSYDLNTDRIVQCGATNTISIKNGEVTMEWANCPDQICVHHVSISKNGESIICLPNHVVITVENSENTDLDSIAR